MDTPGNFGCYMDCLKILGPEQFESAGWTNFSEKQEDAITEESMYAVGPNPFGKNRQSPHYPYYYSSSSPLYGHLMPHSHPNLAPGVATPFPQHFVRVRTAQLRRYCITCGVRYGCYKPGRYIERLRGEKVWVCRCFRIHEYGTTNCKVCKAMPLLSRRRRGNR